MTAETYFPDQRGETFADYMARERERIHAEREAILTQQSELETQLASLNREMTAIDAYEAAKAGKLTVGTPAATTRRRSPTAGKARAGSKREQIISLVGNHPQGLGRGELLELTGMKGDKSGEMSISNALTALIKANTLTRIEGKYHLAQAA